MRTAILAAVSVLIGCIPAFAQHESHEQLGTVSFDDMYSWQRIQISQTPGKRIALAGVVLALAGLMGSLFIRSRRVWVRARPDGAGGTLVEVAALERSGGGDIRSVLDDLVSALRDGLGPEEEVKA